MKRNSIYIVVATLCLCLIGCTNQKTTIIQGLVKLDGINEISLSGFYENPIWGIGKEFNVEIDSTRIFKFEIDIEQLSECWLQFGMGTEKATSRRLIIFPGDELEIIIDETGISFNGKGAEINKLYSEVEAKGLHTYQLINPLMYSHISLDNYIESIKGFQESRVQLLKNQNNNNEVPVELTRFYIDQTELDYRFLCLAAFRHYFYTNDRTVNLFELFKNEIAVAKFTNDEWIIYKDYISLLRSYLFYVKGVEIIRNSRGIDLFKGIETALTDSLKGKTQQYALAEYICSNLDVGEYDSLLVNHFNKIALDEFAKKTVADALRKYEQKEFLIGNPLHEEFATTLLADTANNQLSFEEMLRSYEGNIVYMELWSLSCGSCIRAMPTSREMEREIGNLPVKFVYLTTDRLNDNLWKYVFEASLTKENHYRLVNGSNSRMNRFMNSTLVPWYLLFDKQGNLLDFRAEEPYTIKERLIELAS
jgi:thiol-disulfide isomerase/thioredoxin